MAKVTMVRSIEWCHFESPLKVMTFFNINDSKMTQLTVADR